MFADAAPDYSAVQRIFTERCLDCHASQDPEAKLVLESFETLMKGGENGPALVPSHSSDSLLVRMIEGKVERGGKQKIMPPGKRAKLTPEEIGVIRAWIDGGAHPSSSPAALASALAIPKIKPRIAPRHPIHAAAFSKPQGIIALGRDGEIDLVSAGTHTLRSTISVESGRVNSLAFSSDGQFLYGAGGEPGLTGRAWQWRVSDWTLLRTYDGHKDALYALALSPDGKLLATGGYDQKIKLWDTQSGAELKTLSGHNGAVLALAFRPDGQLLASGSADRTVKLWDVASGQRRDTLSQSLKEINSVIFSADGQRLYGAGGDNRVRVWSISEKATETTNPLLDARFAHEGAILALAFSPDGKVLATSATDRAIKLWDTANLTERTALEPQSDWSPALVFVSGMTGVEYALLAGRLDGSFKLYNAVNGQPLAPPKPELSRIEPRGIERGTSAEFVLTGTQLGEATDVLFSHSGLSAVLDPSNEPGANTRSVKITAAGDLPPGAYEVWIRTAAGESARRTLQVDNLRQLYATSDGKASPLKLGKLPVSVWGVHEQSGQADRFSFYASPGDNLVFETLAKDIGSKAASVLTLSDAEGKVLASSTGTDLHGDPLLSYQFSVAGEYQIRVSELGLGASPEHFYRLSVGAFPFVTGCFPLSVPVGKDSSIELIGYNLPADHTVTLHPESLGEFSLALPPNQWRHAHEFKLLASDLPEIAESEPNDTPALANAVKIPCSIAGRIASGSAEPDQDLFRFEAHTGQSLIIETAAAQRGSPIDTRLEILHPDGSPVQRIQLRAVRDSSVTFRGIDSDTTDCRLVNWEEMDLNQYLYVQGEVVRLFRAPQGPDSGFLFYSAHGKRRCYFDTSPAAHAVDAPCYIVEPRPPGAKLGDNGLPVFPLYYANDDDGERKLGTDSKIAFTPPSDGTYLVRVTDTRGFGGSNFVYRLLIRPAAPDFDVQLKPANLSVNAGSGQAFTVEAERIDGFEGDIKIAINHLPAGFAASSPLVIQSGHTTASGTLFATRDVSTPSPSDWEAVQVTASADVAHQSVFKAVNNFTTVKLVPAPKLYVSLLPDASEATASAPASASSPGSNGPLELTIAPGQTIPALLRVERNGHDDLVTFTVENLPHGVIVDNIGLNGVLIPKGQNERQIFLTAAKWVPNTDRLCFAIESQAGRQTSRPVLLHVRAPKAMNVSANR